MPLVVYCVLDWLMVSWACCMALMTMVLATVVRLVGTVT